MKAKITIILMIIAILFVHGHVTTIAAQERHMTNEQLLEQLSQQS